MTAKNRGASCGSRTWAGLPGFSLPPPFASAVRPGTALTRGGLCRRRSLGLSWGASGEGGASQGLRLPVAGVPLAARRAAASRPPSNPGVAEGGAPSRGAFYAAASRALASPRLTRPAGPTMAAPPTGLTQVSGRWRRGCCVSARAETDPGGPGAPTSRVAGTGADLRVS